MRALAVSLFSLAVAACGAPSRSADAVSPASERRSLPAITLAPAPSAIAMADAGAGAEVSPAFPRLASLEAFGEGDRIADLSSLAVARRTLLAWVTYFDPNSLPAARPSRARGAKPAPSAPPTKVGASVLVRALDERADPVGPATVISVKAQSVGGVALAAAGDEPALAWVGIDAGVGQVFLTRISTSGEKQAQKMITHSKGGCTDVALAAAFGGYVVGWIEPHDATAVVNVVKVSKDLAKIGAERKVADAKGDASELHLLAKGDELWLAWNEVRPDAALSGIFGARLKAPDLASIGDLLRVATTAPHARGLDLAAAGEGALLAWIEDDTRSRGAGTSPAKLEKRSIVLASLDASMHFAGDPARPALASDPTAIALDCRQGCRVVVSSADQEQLLLDGFGFQNGRADPTSRLLAIAGSSTEDTSPVLVGDWLFFAEDNLHGAGRVRRGKILWR
jgi:hypothetical protein